MFTIGDMVQQVLFQVYGVRLDTSAADEEQTIYAGWFHNNTDKFKEVVMEANLVLQELQKEADWVWLRDRWEIGMVPSGPGIPEFEIPEDVYKVCSNYGDAIRLHTPYGIQQIPIVTPWTGNRSETKMYNEWGELNTTSPELRAFVVGKDLTFSRPFLPNERGLLETDVIRTIPKLHICTDDCEDECEKAYGETPEIFQWCPDPLWITTRTAAKRAAKDPSAADQVQVLTDEATKLMSAMRENHAMHTGCEWYETQPLGYVSVY